MKTKAQTFEWSLDNLSKLLKMIHVVKDTKRRDFVIEIVKTFESKVLARKHLFKQGKLMTLLIMLDFTHKLLW